MIEKHEELAETDAAAEAHRMALLELTATGINSYWFTMNRLLDGSCITLRKSTKHCTCSVKAMVKEGPVARTLSSVYACTESLVYALTFNMNRIVRAKNASSIGKCSASISHQFSRQWWFLAKLTYIQTDTFGRSFVRWVRRKNKLRATHAPNELDVYRLSFNSQCLSACLKSALMARFTRSQHTLDRYTNRTLNKWR